MSIDNQHSRFRRFTNACIVVINAMLCLGMIASAYSGRISPVESKYAAVMMYTFPGWLIGVLLAFIFDLIWWRRTAMIAGLSMLICLPQICDFTPLNLPRGKMNEQEQARSFTLMTYNVMGFQSQDKYSIIDRNEQLDYIMAEQPDVVCIEEAMCMVSGDNIRHITPEQIAELNEIYPYIYIEGESFALLSKYKAEAVNIGFPKNEFKSGDIACWRLYINGETINLFVVHLRSFAFTYDERDLFQEATENATPSKIEEVKTDLLPIITSASTDRTAQYEWLIRCLRKYGGENTIVCGDFNDPVGCYGLYKLGEESHLRQVYSEVGFGPMITYNANNFYFRIDHVLYRGALKPYSISRGDTEASDHYPLTVTFLTEDNKED